MTSEYKSKFQEIGLLGCGGYSRVFEAKCIKDGNSYAIKKIPFKEEELDKTLKEIIFFGELESDYVVRYYHSWVESNYYNFNQIDGKKNLLVDPEMTLLLHIQMELCSMTLKQFISYMNNTKKNSLKINHYSIACEIFTQLLECVNYLHTHNPQIIHRDLNPKNILLTNSGNNRCVKLADLGLSTFHETEDHSHTSCIGTAFYKAPEVINRDYTIKADIYSIGMILKELFHMEFVSDSIKNDSQIHQKYEKLKEICLSCFAAVPKLRPSCEQLLFRRNKWNFTQNIKKDLFVKITEVRQETVFKFNFEKWPLIKNIKLEFLKNCKSMSIIEEFEEKAIFISKDKNIYTLRVSNNIDSTTQQPNIINELINKEIQSIVCGYCHVVCLTKDMHVYSFGDNTFGQLGNGTYESNNKPVIVRKLEDKSIIDIKCGNSHSLALIESGTVYVWGSGMFGQLGNGWTYNICTPLEVESLNSAKITSISCGFNHCFALCKSGILYGWGDNSYGQLGIGNYNNQYKPIIITFEDNITIKKINCGPNHSLVLTSDNNIYAFGGNYFGQLGIGTNINQTHPIKVQTTIKFIDIETTISQSLSVGLSLDNKYYIWGNCNNESIISPKQTNFTSFNEIFIHSSPENFVCQNIIPDKTKNLTKRKLLKKLHESSAFKFINQEIFSNMILLIVVRINESKGIFVTNDDMVYSFRLNESMDSSSDEPVIVNVLSNKRIKTIICGRNHVLCLTNNYQVYSFGNNSYGQLGNGSNIDNYKPSIITELNDKRIVEMSCGAHHCLALSEFGDVFVWGNGYRSQLGNNENESILIPVKVNLLNSIKITSISCGQVHCLALSSNGDLYGWGDNRFGQLSIGNNFNQNKPTLIGNNDKLIINKISCGLYHSLLLTNNFIIYSFGYNGFGELGIGNQVHQNKMTKIETSIKFIDIHTNWCDSISAGLSQTGKYYIWGKCGDHVITSPKQTEFCSFDEIFSKYSTEKFLYKSIYVNKNR